MLDYFTKNLTFTNFHFLLYGIFITALFMLCFNCKTTTPHQVEKLDLSLEKKYIEDALDIPDYQKKKILDTFDRTENFCNDCVLVVHQLQDRVSDLEAENISLNKQARIYRAIRNALFGSLVLLGIYYFRVQIVSLIKMVLKI